MKLQQTKWSTQLLLKLVSVVVVGVTSAVVAVAVATATAAAAAAACAKSRPGLRAAGWLVPGPTLGQLAMCAAMNCCCWCSIRCMSIIFLLKSAVLS